MARPGGSLSRRLGKASALVRSAASGAGLAGRIRGIQSMLCEMRATRPGIVRVLGAVGALVAAHGSRVR